MASHAGGAERSAAGRWCGEARTALTAMREWENARKRELLVFSWRLLPLRREVAAAGSLAAFTYRAAM